MGITCKFQNYALQSDIPKEALKYYYGPDSRYDDAMGGFALVSVEEYKITVSFIDYKGISYIFINSLVIHKQH